MSGAIEITGDASIWTLGYISYSNPLLPALLKDPYTYEGSYDSLFKAGSENEDREKGGTMSDGLGLEVENHLIELFGAGPSNDEFSEYKEEANAA